MKLLEQLKKNKMEVLKIQKDYGWVLKVLDSCVTEKQIETSKRVFENFTKKWSDEISEERLKTFQYNFNRYVSQKMLNVKKIV